MPLALVQSFKSWLSGEPPSAAPDPPSLKCIDFPNELWIDTWSKILSDDPTSSASTDALRNLTLTSHRFRLIAQPLLFQRTGINIKYARGTSEAALIARMHGLGEFVSGRPDVARHVRSARFVAEHATLSEDISLAFIQLLARLPRVEDVLLDGLPLYDALLRQLSTSQNLRAVRLYNTPAHSFGADFEWGASIRLDGCTELEELEALSLAHLISGRTKQVVVDLATASARTLRRVRINSPELSSAYYRSIVDAGAVYMLTAVHLDAPRLEDLGRLFALLERCPDLLDLRLSMQNRFGIQEDLVYNSPVPGSAAPKLRTLHAPVALARVLVPGRPVTKLVLDCRNSGNVVLTGAEFAEVRKGTAVVRCLKIYGATWTDDCLRDVARTFPELTELSITETLGDYLLWLSENGASELLNLPDLRRLRILGRDSFRRVVAREIDEVRNILSKLVPAHRSLVEAELYPHTVWRRRRDSWDPVMDPSLLRPSYPDRFTVEPFDDRDEA